MSSNWRIETEVREHDPRGPGHYAVVTKNGENIRTFGPFASEKEAMVPALAFIERRAKSEIEGFLGL